jgi:hypothetical protein
LGFGGWAGELQMKCGQQEDYFALIFCSGIRKNPKCQASHKNCHHPLSSCQLYLKEVISALVIRSQGPMTEGLV